MLQTQQIPVLENTPQHQDHHRFKKVQVNQLQPGMYIDDLNAGWLDHPFLTNSLLIRSTADIEEIAQHGIREVFIDISRGLDIPEAPTAADAARASTQEMLSSIKEDPAILQPLQTPLSDEIKRARRILEQASSQLKQTLQSIRQGKIVNIEPLEQTAKDISETIIRNPNAMNLICRLRNSDEYTFTHSLNVGVLLTSFAYQQNFPNDLIQAFALGGLLHDVGKMSVDESILNKPGKLTEQEFAHIKNHVDLGIQLVTAYSYPKRLPEASLQIIKEHHERFDGNGYPAGRCNEDISIAGRMAAIVDVYDAISTDRCYHKGIPPAEAVRRMFEWRGHFDPELVQQFVRCIGIYPVGSLVRLESQRLAIVLENDTGLLLRPRVKVIYDIHQECYVLPELLDLASSQWKKRDWIISHEDPKHWGVDIYRHVG